MAGLRNSSRLLSLKKLEDIIERDRLAVNVSCMMRSLGGRTDARGNKTSKEMDF